MIKMYVLNKSVDTPMCYVIKIENKTEKFEVLKTDKVINRNQKSKPLK